MSGRIRRSPGQKGASRRRKRRTRKAIVLGFVVPLVVAALLAFLYVYVDVTLTFEGRFTAAPSRIYSDAVVVASGAPLGRDSLIAWLDRSGYVAVPAEPTRPGEYARRGGVLDLHLRSFDAGPRSLPQRRVRIAIDGERVVSLRGDDGRRLERVELEPELLAVAFGARQEERQVVRLAEVPERFVRAVLAAEDARFYEHPGFDPLAIVRAVLANAREGRIVQGGSTITQQTVKNLYLDQKRTWWRKLREAGLAVILDLRYSKDRILETYLNEVYLGQRGSVAICGVQAAAFHYFGRDVAHLSLSESAVLAGLIRNPGGYNPFLHPDRATSRRDQVLGAMVEKGWIGEAEAGDARREPLRLATRGAGFSRDPWAIDFARAQLATLDLGAPLEDGALQVFTTIDPFLQEATERALRRGLDRLERGVSSIRRRRGGRIEGCVLVLDPRNGAVLAIVGGRDYASSQFNRAIKAARQPGSAFKPFVYLAGVEAARRSSEGGITPATPIEDAPIEIMSGGSVWRPSNYDGAFRGIVSAREALELSLNVPTVKVAEAVGLDEVVDAARACGVTSRLQPLPSLSLGAQEVTPLELAAAYGTLANGGLRVEPRIVGEVLSRDGVPLASPHPVPVRAIDSRSAFLVTDMLRGVLTRGTAASAYALGFRGEAAGKTGTTDDTRDAWFVGYTPEIVTLVWVGFDDNGSTGLTGASGALPIWVDVMSAARHRGSLGTFVEPPGMVRVDVDPESGERVVAGCPERIEEVFIAGTEPTEPCHLHEGGFLNWLRNLFRRRQP